MSGQRSSPPIAVIGLNYRAAPVEIRERLAFGPERISDVLQELVKQGEAGIPAVREAVLLSTCNRTELYFFYTDFPQALEMAREVLIWQAGMRLQEWQSAEYALQGEEAVLHLMRVATGLDSLVVGENEILGQVRKAFEVAQAAGTSGPALSALFQTAIRAGKRARTETSIGSRGLSVASVVVELAEQIIGPLEDRTALLIGAGKVSSMTARALAGAGLKWILIANRNFERAKKLAGSLNGRAVHFDALEDSLSRADIVICSTGAPHLVLHTDPVRKAQQARHGQPLLIADLAVPRDADPQIENIPGVRLVNIDDLQDIMQEDHLPADAVCKQVESIARQEQEAFSEWYAVRRCSAVIQALHLKAEQIYTAEAQRTLRRLGPLTTEQQKAIQAMAEAIAEKMLHDPVARLREHSLQDDPAAFLDFTRDLYRLP